MNKNELVEKIAEQIKRFDTGKYSYSDEQYNEVATVAALLCQQHYEQRVVEAALSVLPTRATNDTNWLAHRAKLEEAVREVFKNDI